MYLIVDGWAHDSLTPGFLVGITMHPYNTTILVFQVTHLLTTQESNSCPFSSSNFTRHSKVSQDTHTPVHASLMTCPTGSWPSFMRSFLELMRRFDSPVTGWLRSKNENTALLCLGFHGWQTETIVWGNNEKQWVTVKEASGRKQWE